MGKASTLSYVEMVAKPRRAPTCYDIVFPRFAPYQVPHTYPHAGKDSHYRTKLFREYTFVPVTPL
ncbi:hypothetical protein M378DRAFT_170886 [Amanita muscaria Koide BX008]|uniref:Uncharacterized protein n=1 Tax=Amanita muscaria (strain Koide BX008) TaxID=946122 RepID=A0A0C2WPI4_AMAMK|nr:hypothetical protein M378DRAFT_170886 [Amanita muscaria Koide BX008]